jgi:hypothetical protein
MILYILEIKIIVSSFSMGNTIFVKILSRAKAKDKIQQK